MNPSLRQTAKEIVAGRQAATTRRGFLDAGAKLAGAGALALSGLRLVGGPTTALAQDGTPTAAVGGQATPAGAEALDPQMKEVLDELGSLSLIPVAEQTPFNARQLPGVADAVMSLLSKRGQPAQQLVGSVQHRLIPTPDGNLVARVYSPQGNGPFPVLVYFHGGGWVIANLNTYDASCRALTNAAGCVVVSVAYRQAPENPFPAAANDAYNAFQYVAQNASAFGGDPNRVAVAGESAGGNLAAVTCLLARDQRGILPIHQLLVYPITNNDFTTPSYQENANARPLNRALMQFFFANYLTDPAQGNDPSVSPLKATSFAGLPPATVILAQFDPLRSEGRAYADALRQAGIDVQATTYQGVTHEFFGTGAVVDKGKRAVDEAAQRLRAAFERGNATPTA